MISARLRTQLVAESNSPLNESLGSEILDQTNFTQMLCLERKRTERSGRRFVLMLLQWGTLVRPKDNDRALENVLRTLLNSTRETDIKGWYKDGSIVGVIFTEIGNADGKAVTNALLNRVTSALSSTLTIEEVNEVRISFHVFPDELAEHGHDVPRDLTLYPDQISEASRKQNSRLLKRAIDVSGSVVALILLSPVLLLIALAIKMTSRGPVLFRQQRVGLYGRVFTFLKFRSMHLSSDETIHKEYVTRFISGTAGSEEPETQQRVFKLKNDPRVTRIGRFLRRTSLDELPQFVNVLRGEMSLVGPRPPIQYEYACYDTWHRRRLLTVKPGITGLWQVCGRSKVTFDDMVRLDLRYADTWSVWLDLKILLRTPAAALSGDGAY